MRGLCLIAQPLVVALAMGLWILHNEVAVLNADGIIESLHSPGASPEVSELPVTFQIDGVPDDMIVDMGLVDMSADDKGVVPLSESPGKLLPQPVCFLCSDLAGDKRLAQMIGNHIICAAHPASLLNVSTAFSQTEIPHPRPGCHTDSW